LKFSWRRIVAAVAGVALIVVACGDDRPGPTGQAESSTAPPGEPTDVVISVVALDNSFRPQQIEISVGDKVLWENRGQNEHNLLFVADDEWGVEVEGFQPGSDYTHVFTRPGAYAFYCSIHGNETVGMTGKVVVSE